MILRRRICRELHLVAGCPGDRAPILVAFAPRFCEREAMRPSFYKYLVSVLTLALIPRYSCFMFYIFRGATGKILLIVGLPSKVAGLRPGRHYCCNLEEARIFPHLG